MEIKGIDVSSYQGKPDWKKLRQQALKLPCSELRRGTGLMQALSITLPDAGQTASVWECINFLMHYQ